MNGEARGEPLITIAIPNFNYGRFLIKCIDSVVSQIGDDCEVLISDNCSTDNSWEIITTFARRNVRIWRQDKNIGLYPNWNFLLRHARGRFFKLLQSDDWLESECISQCRLILSNVEQVEIAALLLGYKVADARGRVAAPFTPQDAGIPDYFQPSEDFMAAMKSLSFSMPTLNALNTRTAKLCGGYLPENGMRSDTILFARVLTHEPKHVVASSKSVAVVTRTHTDNDRRNYSRFAPFRDEIVFLSVMSSLPQAGSHNRFLKEMIGRASAQSVISLFIDLYRRRDPRKFVNNARWVLLSRSLALALWRLPGEISALCNTALKRLSNKTTG